MVTKSKVWNLAFVSLFSMLVVACGSGVRSSLPGSSCTRDEDCSSLNCSNRVCAEPSCNDGILNDLESDVDCGRACAPNLCAIGERCQSNNDCDSGLCRLTQVNGEGYVSLCNPSEPTPTPRTGLTDDEKTAIRDWLLRFRLEIMEKFEGYLIGNKPIVPVPLQPWDEIICYSCNLADCKEDCFPVDLSWLIIGFGELSWDLNDLDITYGENDYMTIGPDSDYFPENIYWILQSHIFEPDDLPASMSYLAYQLRREHEALGSPEEACPPGYDASEEVWEGMFGGIIENVTGQTFDEYADSLGLGCSQGEIDIEAAKHYRLMALRYWELANEFYDRLWELTE